MSIRFNHNDTYTASGALSVYNSWTSNVTKHDTSSFYNWEQDNLPLYDLEERSLLAWERLGYPTSSTAGMVLTVSADADNSALNCNSNLFTSVSGAIAALPEVIRMPVWIEVASYGLLGNMELHNLKFAESGSLEIINRNFAKAFPSAAIVGTRLFGNTLNKVADITSADVSAQLKDAGCLGIGQPVFSSTQDTRIANNPNMVVLGTPPFDSVNSRRQNSLSVSPVQSTVLDGTVNTFIVADYESSSVAHDASIPSYDVSSFVDGQEQEEQHIRRRLGPAAASQSMGLIYGNKASRISVQNCNGPIFLRNFAVDGRDHDNPFSTVAPRLVGVEISNSTSVTLENMTAVRCVEAGFKFSNSIVNIVRGIVSYRNYELSTSPIRVITRNGAGLKAVNSEVTFSSIDFTKHDAFHSEYSAVRPMDFFINLERNTVGIDSYNSTVKGGLQASALSQASSMTYFGCAHNNVGMKLHNSVFDWDGRLDVWDNERGVEAINSLMDIDEMSVDISKYEGLKLYNTILTYNKNLRKQGTITTEIGGLDQLFFSGNGQHLVAKDSVFSHMPEESTGSGLTPVISVPDKMGKIKFFNSHGIDPNKVGVDSLPSVVLDDSQAEFIHTRIECAATNAENFFSNTGVFGAAIAAKNGSTATFKGSKAQATVIEGVTGYSLQKKTAGVFAGNQSTIEFNGPTVIAKFGVDALAKDHSTIRFNPHRTENGGYDLSGWNLDNTENHTAVELHSTRACLVADRNSNIIMRDLGDYHRCWDISAASAVDYNADNAFGTSAYIEGGSMQFYPNPMESTIFTEFPSDNIGNKSIADTFTGITYTHQNPAGTAVSSLKNIIDCNVAPPGGTDGGGDYMLDVARGGMCVRALGNSVVDVKNVHFLTGYDQASGVYLDASADCGRIYIWNIADNSKLQASILSVSGQYPSYAGYHGPSSVYASADGFGGNWPGVVASGAPSGTADTGYLSVLDEFGQGVHYFRAPEYSVNSNTGNWNHDVRNKGGRILSPPVLETGTNKSVGRTTWDNQGPFRLMVSVKPEARYLLLNASASTNQRNPFLIGTAMYGPATQIFAQGYALSADASASPIVSSVHRNLVNEWDRSDGKIVDASDTSGFYYQDLFVDDTYMNIVIDESAANTFANAKNGALGRSHRSRLCSITKSTDEPGGEAYSTNLAASGGGVGFRSVNIFDLTREV